MAINQNGGYPVQASSILEPLLNAKEPKTELFALTTSRKRLNATGILSAGTFKLYTDTSSCVVYFYDANDALLEQITVTTSTTTRTQATGYGYIMAIAASGTPVLAIQAVSSDGTNVKNVVLEAITSSGNYAPAGGTAASYGAEGQKAYVVVFGGVGGGGSGRNGGYNNTGMAGGDGGSLAATTNLITLSGTYSISLGSGGSGAAAPSYSSNGTAGNAGTSTNAFSLTVSGGAGGAGGTGLYGGKATSGATFNDNTNISRPTSYNVVGADRGGYGGAGSWNGYQGNAGGSGSGGKVVVLRWTP